MAKYTQRDYEFVADVLHRVLDSGVVELGSAGRATLTRTTAEFVHAFEAERAAEQERESILASRVGRDERVLPYFDRERFYARVENGHKCSHQLGADHVSERGTDNV